MDEFTPPVSAESDPAQERYKAEVYQWQRTPWDTIKDSVVAMAQTMDEWDWG